MDTFVPTRLGSREGAKKMKKIKMQSYNFQADVDQVAKAKTMVDLPALLRAIISKIVKEKTCPVCGGKVKAGR